MFCYLLCYYALMTSDQRVRDSSSCRRAIFLRTIFYRGPTLIALHRRGTRIIVLRRVPAGAPSFYAPSARRGGGVVSHRQQTQSNLNLPLHRRIRINHKIPKAYLHIRNRFQNKKRFLMCKCAKRTRRRPAAEPVLTPKTAFLPQKKEALDERLFQY